MLLAEKSRCLLLVATACVLLGGEQSWAAGKVLSNNGLVSIDVLDLSYTKALTDVNGISRYPKQGSGYRWAVLMVVVQNTSGADLDNFAPFVAATMEDSETFTYEAECEIEYPQQIPTVEHLRKGAKIKGRIAFAIPKKAKARILNWNTYPYAPNGMREPTVVIELADAK